MGRDRSRQSRALRRLERYNKSPNGTSRGCSKDRGTGDDRTTHESPCTATSSRSKSPGSRSRSRSPTQLPEWAKQLLQQQQSNAAELKRLQNELVNATVPKVAKKQHDMNLTGMSLRGLTRLLRRPMLRSDLPN